MAQIMEYIHSETETLIPLCIGITAVLLAVTLALLWNYWRLHKGMRAYRQILERFGDQDIEQELSGLLSQVALLDKRMAAEEQHGAQQDSHIVQLQQHVHTVVQQVGLVRYNAFPDVAGDQSYSLAMLNLDGDGVVLTTLHGRAEARTYCKLIVKGGSSYPLLPEEQRAIFQALQDGKSKKASTAAHADHQGSDDRRAYLLGRREDTVGYQFAHPHPERSVPEPTKTEQSEVSPLAPRAEETLLSAFATPSAQAQQARPQSVGSAPEAAIPFYEGVTILPSSAKQEPDILEQSAETAEPMVEEVPELHQQQSSPGVTPTSPPPWHASGILQGEPFTRTRVVSTGGSAASRQEHVFDGTEAFPSDAGKAADRSLEHSGLVQDGDPKKGR